VASQAEKQNALANAVASESIGAIRTVVAFTAEARVLIKYQQTLIGPHRDAIRNAHITGKFVNEA
jgi:hypothetical protein